MASEDKRFNVTLRAEIQTEDSQPFADETIQYHNLSYEGVVMLEQVWSKFHQDLAGLGQARLQKNKQ